MNKGFNFYKKPVLAFAAACAALTLMSCVTVNKLDEYMFEGSAVAPRIHTPMRAEVNLSRGNIPGAEDNALLTLVQIGADVAVGVQEYQIEQRINSILRGEDLSHALHAEFVPEVATTLDMMTVQQTSSADYILDVEVTEYGITSSSGGIYMNISIDSRIIFRADGETVWRRRLSVSEPASPSFFGINDYVGTAISVSLLSELSDEDLRTGFDLLSEQAAFELSERFRADYYKALRR